MDLARTPLLIESQLEPWDFSLRNPGRKTREARKGKSDSRLTRRDRRRIAKLRAKNRGRFAPLGPTDPLSLHKRELRSKRIRGGSLASIPDVQINKHSRRKQPEAHKVAGKHVFTKSGSGVYSADPGSGSFSHERVDPADRLKHPRSLFL